MRAVEVASYFMDKNLDTPRDTFKGNMKLQKLLYFSQLISLAKFDKPLFGDEIYAFENGMVVDDIRKKYKTDYQSIANLEKRELSKEDKKILGLTVEIFGKYSADQLSEITHHHLSWKLQLRNGTAENGYHDKEASIVDIKMLKANEVPDMKDLIESNEVKKDLNKREDKVLEFNGSSFYYDDRNVDAEKIKEFVNAYNFPKGRYTAYMENEEVYVY